MGEQRDNQFYNGNRSNDVLALDHDELILNQVHPGKPILSNWSDLITPLHCCHQYFGGDIAGITKKLDYLRSLGVTITCLSPIVLSRSAHGYDPYDYYKLDPKFGNEKELREFLRDSHDTSRVLTDLGGGSLGDTPTNESIQRLKLLSTLLYSLPGTPVTFQGGRERATRREKPLRRATLFHTVG